jgi:hypothetical protein
MGGAGKGGQFAGRNFLAPDQIGKAGCIVAAIIGQSHETSF